MIIDLIRIMNMKNKIDNDYGISIMIMTLDIVKYDKDVYYNVINVVNYNNLTLLEKECFLNAFPQYPGRKKVLRN